MSKFVEINVNVIIVNIFNTIAIINMLIYLKIQQIQGSLKIGYKENILTRDTSKYVSY